ncbi:hypothetical protein DFH08DRAFT_851198 [Mycena albidolilacea]|uniref:Uncharacterized protein n=1 Tax=Mycena albidolilacea TaxID=1033008 RepID=A0AAD7AFR2_9AGAR|nr:hypothetical protein DFH08DRAFT_851198 [Mycena albidolilacea]
MLEVRVHRSFLLLFLSFVALSSQLVAGQTLIKGQTFTNGLAIIDSPSSQTPGHAGSPINIAIDVSGNGALPAAASLPDSHYSTGFGSLEIYLVSAQTNINMTVSAGPALLSGESGSTVKHLNWPIPACMPAGDYNLTFYENSLFNTQGIFTITSIPIPISNPSPAGQCTENLNPLQAQPQSSNPLPQPPFAPGSPLSASEASATSSVVPGSQSTTVAPTSSVVPGSQSTTVAPTPSASRMVTVISGSPFVTLTLTLSDGVLNFPTITVTAKPTPTTGQFHLHLIEIDNSARSSCTDLDSHHHRNRQGNGHHLHANEYDHGGDHSELTTGQFEQFSGFYTGQRSVPYHGFRLVVFIIWCLLDITSVLAFILGL